VGVYLADLLRRDSRFEVRTSRNSPNEVIGTSSLTSLATRVNAANSWPANYFVSIHTNANTNPSVNGTEVYVYQEYSQAYYLAERVLNAIVSYLDTKNNGVRIRPSLYVLRKTNMPAILTELAYITNANDAAKLRNNQYQFAEAIYSGLLTYFGF
jgi:N-acetylmuramoyl-L-alanine amidase